MKTNENMVKGKWLEIKGEIQKSWGRLTDDELEKTKGDVKALGGIIQQKYGETQDHYSKKISDIFRRFDAQKDETVEKMKHNLKTH